MRKMTVIFTALLLFCFMPTLGLAHDGDTGTPDGITAPPPPELPQPTGQQTLYRIDPNQSVARYSVQEVYVGTVTHAGSLSTLRSIRMGRARPPCKISRFGISIGKEAMNTWSLCRSRKGTFCG